MVTVAHALVHGIRGTVSNLLFRLYVGQEWLSPATLHMGGGREEEEVDWHYIAASHSLNQLIFSAYLSNLSLTCILMNGHIKSPNCIKMHHMHHEYGSTPCFIMMKMKLHFVKGQTYNV